MSGSRPSQRWRLAGELTSGGRDALADLLGVNFTDENAPRAVLPAAPDVTLTVRPGDGEVVVIAHFMPMTDVPAVHLTWLDELVRKAAVSTELTVTAGPEPVRTGS